MLDRITSAVPRWTGKPPTVSMNRPSGFTFQSESLAMNRNLRLVMQPTTNVSMFERWIGATTQAQSREAGPCLRRTLGTRSCRT